MGTGASTVNGVPSLPPSPPRSPDPTGSDDAAQAAATISRLVLLPVGNGAHGIQMGPNTGMGVLTGTPPVITAVKESSRAFDSRGFVIGDRISHINPRLVGGQPHPASDILGDAAAADSELSRLPGDVPAEIWVRRAARATPVARKPPGGRFGITFVTVVFADGKEMLFVKNTESGSAAHMCGGLPPSCRIITVCGTATTSCTVAARLLGELPVGEVATFDVDHTLRYDSECGTVEPCSCREMPALVHHVSDLKDRV